VHCPPPTGLEYGALLGAKRNKKQLIINKYIFFLPVLCHLKI